MNKPLITLKRWRLFLMLFGGYLFVHFGHLFFWSAETFSNQGIFPKPSDLMTYPYFPNILFLYDSPLVVQGFLIGLMGLSLLFAFNRFPVLVPLLLWYGWTALLTRNPFIRNPGMPYVGWMFLACAVIAYLNKGRLKQDWEFPVPIYSIALLLLGAGYTLSGIHKLSSPSWQNGLALHYLIENPLSRPGMIGQLILSLPLPLIKLQSWSVLALECLGMPLLLIPRFRFFGWTLFVGMHLSIMLVVDFVDLTMGMILIHLFLFDENWMRFLNWKILKEKLKWKK